MELNSSFQLLTFSLIFVQKTIMEILLNDINCFMWIELAANLMEVKDELGKNTKYRAFLKLNCEY